MDDLQNLWRAQSNKLGVERAKLLDHFENDIDEQWKRYSDKKESIERLKSNQKAALSKIACYEALG
jgi:hypothetical protein